LHGSPLALGDGLAPRCCAWFWCERLSNQRLNSEDLRNRSACSNIQYPDPMQAFSDDICAQSAARHVDRESAHARRVFRRRAR
jgi:hypothetical protein